MPKNGSGRRAAGLPGSQKRSEEGGEALTSQRTKPPQSWKNNDREP